MDFGFGFHLFLIPFCPKSWFGFSCGFDSDLADFWIGFSTDIVCKISSAFGQKCLAHWVKTWVILSYKTRLKWRYQVEATFKRFPTKFWRILWKILRQFAIQMFAKSESNSQRNLNLNWQQKGIQNSHKSKPKTDEKKVSGGLRGSMHLGARGVVMFWRSCFFVFRKLQKKFLGRFEPATQTWK